MVWEPLDINSVDVSFVPFSSILDGFPSDFVPEIGAICARRTVTCLVIIIIGLTWNSEIRRLLLARDYASL